MSTDSVKQTWQSSPDAPGALPLDEIRAGANKFHHTIRRRNAIEYAACVLVVAVFTTYVFTLPHELQRIGAGLIVLATFFVAWQLHRRGSAEAPENAGTMPIWMFLRAQLVRQRDALRGIFWWYILPFLPGLALMIVGNARAPGAPPEGPGLREWASFTAMMAGLVGIWWLNQRAARKLQKHIDQIDVLTGGDE